MPNKPTPKQSKPEPQAPALAVEKRPAHRPPAFEGGSFRLNIRVPEEFRPFALVPENKREIDKVVLEFLKERVNAYQ